MTGTLDPSGGGRISGGYSQAQVADVGYPALDPVETGGIVVGVIDTGLVLKDGQPHSWFCGHVTFNEFTDEDPIPTDGSDPTLGSTGHGTFVAGIILSEAPRANILMKGVLDKSTGSVEDNAVAAAIEDLRNAGVKLINLSFGGDTYEQGLPPVIDRALRKLGSDVVVVASAGNSGSERKFYPAASDLGLDHARVISVGAVDVNRIASGSPLIAEFSNHGPWVTAYASGVDVLGPYLGFDEQGVDGFTGWATWSGTSFASAIVTGRIARTTVDDNLKVSAAADKVLGKGDKITVYGVNGPDSENKYIRRGA